MMSPINLSEETNASHGAGDKAKGKCGEYGRLPESSDVFDEDCEDVLNENRNKQRIPAVF